MPSGVSNDNDPIAVLDTGPTRKQLEYMKRVEKRRQERLKKQEQQWEEYKKLLKLFCATCSKNDLDTDKDPEAWCTEGANWRSPGCPVDVDDPGADYGFDVYVPEDSPLAKLMGKSHVTVCHCTNCLQGFCRFIDGNVEESRGTEGTR